MLILIAKFLVRNDGLSRCMLPFPTDVQMFVFELAKFQKRDGSFGHELIC